MSLFSMASALIDKALAYIPDPQQKLKAQEQLIVFAQQELMDQRGINKEEAGHESLFVSGWRPAVGWICVFALGYNYILQPMLIWGIGILGLNYPVPPNLDDMLWELLLGMLGIGGLRTVEKIKGVTKR